MDPRLVLATRIGSRTSEELVAGFVVAHPASAKQEMIVVPRIGCLVGKCLGDDTSQEIACPAGSASIRDLDAALAATPFRVLSQPAGAPVASRTRGGKAQ